MTDLWKEPLDEEDPYERGFAHKLYEDDYALATEPDVCGEEDEFYDQEVQSSYTGYRRPPKKKHPFRKLLLTLFILVVLIPGLLLASLLLFSKAPAGENLGRKEGTATILLAGTDESGDRTDTIMLLNLDRRSGRISLMSIPRDTRVNSTYWPQKINAAYGMNGGGEEGMEALMDYVRECIGFRPDGYILIELDIFIDLVDLFGGVDFYVPMNMYYEDPAQDLYIDLQEGQQMLTGEQAMGLVRYRYGYADADIGRVAVQRNFMMAAISQWAKAANVTKLPKALSLLKEYAVTDLSVSNLTWLAMSVLQCGTEDMQMQTVPFYLTYEYVIIDADEEYLELINGSFNPYTKDVTMEDLTIANCIFS